MVEKNIIFLGMPGSGKGTVSSFLQEKEDIIQVSTGDIFREEIKNKTQLGLEVEKIVSLGAYVPDDITNEIVKNKIIQLEKDNKKFILDGFPRTIEQAKFLDELNFDNYVVIYLDIEKEEVIKRLSQRFFCSKCKRSYNLSNFKSKKHPNCENDDNLLIQRADDQPSAIEKRLEVYQQQTEPLIDFYKKKNKLFVIEVNNNSIDKIVDKILFIIKSK